MISYLPWAILFVIGVGMACAGPRKPTLAERVEALRPYPRPEPEPETSVFAIGAFKTVGPSVESMGRFVARLLRLDVARITTALALAGREESVPLYIGTKVVAAGLVLAGVPVLADAGLIPGIPLWVAAGLAIGAWFAPDVVIRERGRARRVVLEDGLAVACLDIALRVAGGGGVTEAVRDAARGDGAFASELDAALARAAADHRSAADALEDLAARTGLDEARDLATALRAAEQGAPLSETVMAQARAIGERHSQDSQAAGQRAEILMILVQAGLVLPGLFLLVIYPTASTLVRFSRG